MRGGFSKANCLPQFGQFGPRIGVHVFQPLRQIRDRKLLRTFQPAEFWPRNGSGNRCAGSARVEYATTAVEPRSLRR